VAIPPAAGEPGSELEPTELRERSRRGRERDGDPPVEGPIELQPGTAFNRPDQRSPDDSSLVAEPRRF
jgi:hypothetical protein